MIKAVFTDVDDTLIDFYASARVHAEEAFRSCGLPYSEEIFRLYRDISEMLWDRVNRGTLDKEALPALRWNMVFEKIGASCPTDDIDDAMLSCLRKSAICEEGALETVQQLASRYSVHAASNSGGDIQHDRLRIAGLTPYLSGVFISNEVGFAKPDRRFFEACLKDAGVEPHEAVMIGDNVIADMQTPKAMGFTTILYDPSGTKDRSCADYVVAHLSDILDII